MKPKKMKSGLNGDLHWAFVISADGFAREA